MLHNKTIKNVVYYIFSVFGAKISVQSSQTYWECINSYISGKTYFTHIGELLISQSQPEYSYVAF